MASTIQPEPFSGSERSGRLSLPAASASSRRKRMAAEREASARRVRAPVTSMTSQRSAMSARAMASAASALTRRRRRRSDASSATDSDREAIRPSTCAAGSLARMRWRRSPSRSAASRKWALVGRDGEHQIAGRQACSQTTTTALRRPIRPRQSSKKGSGDRQVRAGWGGTMAMRSLRAPSVRCVMPSPSPIARSALISCASWSNAPYRPVLA